MNKCKMQYAKEKNQKQLYQFRINTVFKIKKKKTRNIHLDNQNLVVFVVVHRSELYTSNPTQKIRIQYHSKTSSNPIGTVF